MVVNACNLCTLEAEAGGNPSHGETLYQANKPANEIKPKPNSQRNLKPNEMTSPKQLMYLSVNR